MGNRVITSGGVRTKYPAKMEKKVRYKMGEMDLVVMVEKVADKKGKEVGQ